MINATVKMSSQGQITIPKDIREMVGMVAGSELILTTNLNSPKGITVTPKPSSWIDSVVGIAEGVYGNDSTKYIRNLRNEWDTKDTQSIL